MTKTVGRCGLALAVLGSVASASAADFASKGSGNFSAMVGAPTAADSVTIQAGHTVTLDVDATVAGIVILEGGTLKFDPAASRVLQSSKNVVVYGRLEMKPAAAAQSHLLRFVGVDEAKFVGGGMDVLPTDVGMWVMGNGQLDLVGTAKTAWTRAVGAIQTGATSIALEAAPSGWQIGDELAIAPTEAPTNDAYQNFDERAIIGLSGATVQFTGALARARPMVNGKWTAEVMNLTRNVRIEGTAAGKSHIFIRSAKPQNMKYAQERYMGPRKMVKDENGVPVSTMVLGRYAFHFHHSMEGSRGAIIEGNVIRDTDNHGFVPHMSHGITLRNNVTYNTTEAPYWWDPGEPTHDSLWDHNVAAKVKWVFHSTSSTGDIQFGANGFEIGMGEGNVARNNVAVGVGAPDSGTNGAYNWEANNEGVWGFVGNVAHNNGNGLRNWQNTEKAHVIDGFVAYHNEVALFHGAYANNYRYMNSIFYGNPGGFNLKAGSAETLGVRLENDLIDGAGIADYGFSMIESPLPSVVPVLLRNVTIRNHKKASVHYLPNNEFAKSLDIVNCTLQAPEFYVESDITPTNVVRVQDETGKAYMLKRFDQSGGVLNATFNAKRYELDKPFAPLIWGTGDGLKGEYFNNPNFTGLALTRVDPALIFQNWSSRYGVSPDHSIVDDTYSVRWTGQIQPQYSETYTFSVGSGGGVRVTIGGKVILDRLSEDMYPGPLTASPIALVAGQKYDLKIEYMNEDEQSGLNLYWQSASQPQAYVPMSQLYSGVAPGALMPAPDAPPATNLPPLANAGADQSIQLPVNETKLVGAASDPDGTVAKVEWSVKPGSPAGATIASPTALTTAVTGLIEGTYIFNLKVTDNAAAVTTDEVMVVVKPVGAPVPANCVRDKWNALRCGSARKRVLSVKVN